jgi:hypothetical protein
MPGSQLDIGELESYEAKTAAFFDRGEDLFGEGARRVVGANSEAAQNAIVLVHVLANAG